MELFVKLKVSDGDIVLVKKTDVSECEVDVLAQALGDMGINARVLLVNNIDDIRLLSERELRQLGLKRIKAQKAAKNDPS